MTLNCADSFCEISQIQGKPKIKVVYPACNFKYQTIFTQSSLNIGCTYHITQQYSLPPSPLGVPVACPLFDSKVLTSTFVPPSFWPVGLFCPLPLKEKNNKESESRRYFMIKTYFRRSGASESRRWSVNKENVGI
jgi:hypothetical protein